MEERVLAKLREFSECELDDDERVVFAVLLAPGVELGIDLGVSQTEVEGFATAVSSDPLAPGQHWLSSLLRGAEDLTDGW